jgi:uncharacterized membrane protein YgdD (TMEM256/DUF423 family)
MKKRFLILGGFSGAKAVALGALGAHYLKSQLSTGLVTESNLQTFETAVKYQMYHSILLVILALFTEKHNDRLFVKSGHCFLTGIILFSGSLYLLSLANLLGITYIKWLGPITPIGGLFLITGWVLLAVAGLRKKKAD